MKKVILIVTIFVLLTSFVPETKAHPGNTDGDGGHTNHDTGEYHYHHGYPEHDHYDMDGDGDVDCPYEFVNKTDTSTKTGATSHRHSQTSDIDISDIDIPDFNFPIIPEVKLPSTIYTMEQTNTIREVNTSNNVYPPGSILDFIFVVVLFVAIWVVAALLQMFIDRKQRRK